MNIAEIDAASFATNIGQTAAAQMAALLWADDVGVPPILNWFEAFAAVPGSWVHLDQMDEEGREEALLAALDRMGAYVCAKGVDKGEWLYRQAVGWALIPGGIWSTLPYAQRQPWETFVTVTRHAYGDIRAHQLGLEETNRPRAGSVPVTIRREDSIFEEHPDFDELVPEAVESLRLSSAYSRAQDEQRRKDAAEDTMRAQADADNAQFDQDRQRFNGASPTAFDGDGDGRPGGSRRRQTKTAVEKSIERHQRRKPAPMSVGEPPVKPPVNRGGRGRKKTP